MIALPYFNYEVASGEELRVIGGGGIGLEREKLGAFGDAIVVLVSDGIIHVIPFHARRRESRLRSPGGRD